MIDVFEHRIAVDDGVDLRVLDHRNETGRGAALLLVHGLASNALLWSGTAHALAARGHRVIAVDQRGHGHSAKPDHGYDFATVSRDLLRLIGRLGLDRPIVIGQSWGGNVVLDLAARQPDAVTAVVAVDGGFIDLGSRFADWDDCRAALTPPSLTGTPVRVMEERIRAFHPHWPEDGIRGALANFEVRSDGTIAPWLSLDRHLAILRALYEQRPAELFPRVEVPVLLVPADTGDVLWTHDKRVAVDAALAALPHGEAHWFSPADHDIHAQYPDELADVVARFVARHTETRP